MASDLTRHPQHRHTMHRLEELKRKNAEGNDYWAASEIHRALGYPVWDKFLPVIERAKAALREDGVDVSHHIAETSKLMGVGKGAQRRVAEYFLSRAACYLIAMNGDPNKPEVGGAQRYFASATRLAELAASEGKDRKRLEKRAKVTAAVKRVGDAAKQAGVVRYGIFHNARFQGLYDANKKDVERAKSLPAGEDFLNHVGTLELSAHEFQMELAAEKIASEGINGDQNAIDANLAVAKDVRAAVKRQGIDLGKLPLEREPIAALQKRLGEQHRRLK